MSSASNRGEGKDARPRVTWLISAVVVTLAMFGWLGWHVYNTFKVGQEVTARHARAEELRDTICDLHQRLAATAVMAIASGEPRWASRYREFANRLTATVGDALEHGLPGYNLQALDRVRETHDVLRDMDARAFALAREGQSQAALTQLFSPEYEGAREAFSEAARGFLGDYRRQIDERLDRERDKELLSLGIALAIFSITLVIWVVLMRRLERRGQALALEVAERERAELALRRREDVLSQAQKIAHLGSFEVDLDSGREEWSEEFQRILGYEPGTIAPQREAFLERVHPQDRPGLEAVLSNPHEREVEIRIRRPQGEERHAAVRTSLERGVGGTERRLVGTLHDTTERKQIEDRLRRSQEELRRLGAHLESARERERKVTAQEIHDDMGQAMAALKMDLFRLKAGIPPGDEAMRDLTAGMVEAVDKAILAVERIMLELHPPGLDDLGLAAAVEWQLGRFQGRSGIRCTFECEDEDLGLSPEASLALFRILQESITNVARHARATRVRVKLTREPDAVVLEVRDDGRGISPEALESGSSFGLLGIRERAYAVGGRAAISGEVGRGTTVSVRVPLGGGQAYNL